MKCVSFCGENFKVKFSSEEAQIMRELELFFDLRSLLKKCIDLTVSMDDAEEIFLQTFLDISTFEKMMIDKFLFFRELVPESECPVIPNILKYCVQQVVFLTYILNQKCPEIDGEDPLVVMNTVTALKISSLIRLRRIETIFKKD